MTPGRIDRAGGRRVPFIEAWALVGIDLTGASFSMQLRLYPDAPGAPLVDLATVASAAAEGVRIAYAGSDTVANHKAAGRIDDDEVPAGLGDADTLTLTLISIRINETTMEGLPAAPSPADSPDLKLAYDLHVTPAGGTKVNLLAGDFLVLGGVTR